MNQLTDFLTVGDLAVLVPLVAAFGVYIIRRHNDRQTLRLTLLKEIEQPGDAFSNIQEVPAAPDHDFVPTTVYRSSANNLGLLSDSEVEKIVEYYSEATYLKNILNDPSHTIRIPEQYIEQKRRENPDDEVWENFDRSRTKPAESPDMAVVVARNANKARKEAAEELKKNL